MTSIAMIAAFVQLKVDNTVFVPKSKAHTQHQQKGDNMKLTCLLKTNQM